MVDRDVLICGICTSQFSDLKIFIEHKETCSGPTTAPSSDSTHSSASFISGIANTQPQLSSGVATSFHSLANLGVVVPHFLIPTTSSQVYQIIISPDSSLTPSQPISSTHESNTDHIVLQSETSDSRSQLTQGSLKTDPVPERFVSSEDSKICGTCRPVVTDVVSDSCSVIDTHLMVSEANDGGLSLLSPSQDPMLLTTFDSKSEELRLLSDRPNKYFNRCLSPLTNYSGLEIESTKTSVSNFQSFTVSPLPPLPPSTTSSVQSSLSNDDHSHLSTRLQNVSLPTTHSSLHPTTLTEEVCDSELQSEEEDVATFLATQLVSNVGSKPGVSTELDVKVEQLPVTIAEKSLCVPTEVAKLEKDSGGRLVCTQGSCSFSTRFKRDLTRHIRKHTGEKPFGCDQCSARFSRPDKLKAHQRVHSNERPFVCSEEGCSYRAAEKSHIRKHMRTHTNERPYKCEFCAYRAKDASHLTVHLRTHTGDAPYYCRFEGCSATFKTNSDYKRHTKVHIRQKSSVCSYCSYSTALKSNLRAHIRSTHLVNLKAGAVQSSLGGKMVSPCPPVHSYHVSSSRRGRRKCFKALATEQQESLNHKRRSKERLSLNGTGNEVSLDDDTHRRSFECDICCRTFVRLDSLRAHSRHHQRESVLSSSTSSSSGINSQQAVKPAFNVNNYVITKNVNTESPSEPLNAKTKLSETVFKEEQNASNISQQRLMMSCRSPLRGSIPSYVITIDGVSSVYSASIGETVPGTEGVIPLPSFEETHPIVDSVEMAQSNTHNSPHCSSEENSKQSEVPLDFKVKVT